MHAASPTRSAGRPKQSGYGGPPRGVADARTSAPGFLRPHTAAQSAGAGFRRAPGRAFRRACDALTGDIDDSQGGLHVGPSRARRQLSYADAAMAALTVRHVPANRGSAPLWRRPSVCS
jgi:hypothetical protein